VGKPLKGIEVKIDENNEILVKGPNVMKGYLNLPEDTSKAFRNDEWFRTGDQGRFDESGNLVITGRIKEIIVTSYGKKVFPVPIEEKIAHSEYVSQVMLYGDKQKYIGALVVPEKTQIETYAKKRDIRCDSYQELLDLEVIRKLIEDEITEASKDLPPYAKVKAFALVPEEFSLPNGMLTPTLKLRRNIISEKYQKQITAMYESSD
jgi:long-chain acyl-CoA synthetase